MADRNQDKALIQVTEMRQGLAQCLPQQSVGSGRSSTKQRELFAFFVITVNWGGVGSFKDKSMSRICRFVLHYPAVKMTAHDHA